MSPETRPRIPSSYLRLWLLLALVGSLMLGAVELDRPWKRLQLTYFEHLEKVLEARLEAQRAASESDLEFLEGEKQVALDGLRNRQDDIESLDRQAFDLGRRLKEAEARLAEAEDLAAERESRAEVEALRETIQAKREQRFALLADLQGVEDRLTEAEAPHRHLEQRLRTVRRDAWLRSIPGLRFFAPSLRVRAEPERCVTCHLTMDPELGEQEVATLAGQSVFAAHPRPELVGPSATPSHRDLVCTDCHGGNGRSTDFRRAGHLDSSLEPSAPRVGPEEVILAGPWVQAGCLPCHGNDEASLEPNTESAKDAAPRAESGRRWIARLGCRSCHDLGVGQSPWLDGAKAVAKVGPSLHSIGDKLDAEWVAMLLASPSNHRPGSMMPEFWPGRGRDADEQAEIQAVVAYLFEFSRPPEPFQSLPDLSNSLSKAADFRSGRDLFNGLGCAQCHSQAGAQPTVGPSLLGLKERVGADWLFRWLKQPTAWRHDTPMPDFRLSDSEAADLTAYLINRVPEAADASSEATSSAAPLSAAPPSALPKPGPEVRDRLVLELLESQDTLEAARARFDTMNSAERTRFLGQSSILRYGCHGCHDIPGFEDTPPPDGGDLSDRGRVLRAQLRSGAQPRVLDALTDHPGQWQLSREIRQDVSIQMLSWTSASAGESMGSKLVDPGLELMRRRGCFACHLPGGGEPLIDAPSLHGIGAKLRVEWLHEYLSDPGSRPPTRPWLERRMPSFHFSPQELDALVRFFVERSGAPLFDRPSEPSSKQAKIDSAVGRAAFDVLACARCHWNAPDVGLQSLAPAPGYMAVAERLRPSWVRAWILEPKKYGPAGVMPEHFPLTSEGRRDTSGLRAALDAPMFDVQRIRMEQVFESEHERRAYLDQAENIARALDTYLRQR